MALINKQIVMHVTVGNPSPEHARHSWMWANRLARYPNRLHLELMDLGIDQNQLNKLISDCIAINPNVTVQTNTEQRSGGSERHALGLNMALKGIDKDSDDIHILADSDCYTIVKGWDDIIQHLLGFTDCVGATYEPIGGFSSGTSEVQTYKGIPNCTWIALCANADWNQLDCTPQLGTIKGFLDEEDASIHNLKMGNRLLRDVGWRLPRFLHDKGYSYIGLSHVKPSGTALALKGLPDYHEEFKLAGMPILAHQRGASKHRFAEGPLSERFIKTVDKWCSKQTDLEFVNPDDFEWEISK